jgi:catechol 2,3-dioxygenase-like lactoylglutathione lyase family enzyme
VTASRVGFIGMRVADSASYAATVALYRDQLGLDVTAVDGERSTRFRLADGTAFHVYGPADIDHEDFGDRVCIGLVVDDVDATRADLEAAGIAVLDDPTQRDGAEAWFHYRAPDGTVHEIIGPHRAGPPA